MTLIPFDDRDGLIWLDGRLVKWREAKIHVLTHGLHYGSSVFEGIRSYASGIFRLADHLRRLDESARLIGFDLPYSVEQLDDAVRQTLSANQVSDAYIRPVAWRGSQQMSIGAPASRIHVAIASWPWPSYYDPLVRMRGINLQRARWARPSPKSAPSAAKAGGLYTICTLAKHEAIASGYDDALMLDWRGFVAEATGANFFMFDGKSLLTPIPDCFLDGITRQTIISLARDKGIPVFERHIEFDDLKQAKEVFLTGTAAEITPVRSVEDFVFRPGEITSILMKTYSELTAQANAPYAQ